MGKNKWTRPRVAKQSGPSQTLKRGSKVHAAYTQPRRGREKLIVTGSGLKAMRPSVLLKHLQQLGHLPLLKEGGACLYCGHPSLSSKGCPPLPALLKGSGAKYFRCTKWGCNKQQHVLTRSAVLCIGRGADVLPLRTQVAFLLGDTVAWQGWLGSKARGQRESLVLDKRPLANSVSYAKAGGLAAPPPLSVSAWQDFAGKHLASQTIVHTDGAQAYCAGVEGLELRRAP